MSGEIEQEARSLGWVPQEEFRGDAARWVDAETFVERGHTVMPILRKNNERLEGTVRQQSEEIKKMRQLLEAGQEAIQELQKVHSDATKAAVEKARRDLLAELKIAKADGDVDREIEITEGLAELKAQQAAAAAAPAPTPKVDSTQAGADAMHPDFKAWMAENTWFGSDQRKTMRMMGIAQELRADPDFDSLQGRAFFDKVTEVMAERTGGAPRASKVDGGRPSNTSSGGSGGVKSRYSDLPPDAKEACDRQGKKLVGEGRAFKDMSAWRDYYVGLYYKEV